MQLSGELSKVSLNNLIQLVRNGELSGKIAFLQGTRSATIYVEKGAIVHVEADTVYGRDALMELFLWTNGSFSFIEEPLGSTMRTFDPSLTEDSTDRLLREGVAYAEQRKYIDQLKINGQTILKPTELVGSAPPHILALCKPILDRIDGSKTLAQALADSTISRREYVQAVCASLAEGLAVVLAEPPRNNEEQVSLPPWVVARLKQDNPNLSQAIIDLVIWVDRIKCWMYQADVDLGKVIADLSTGIAPESEEDFWKEFGADSDDYQGPLFGESMPGRADNAAQSQPAPGEQHGAQPNTK